MSQTVILFGGSSSERLVSVASAQNVSRHLPEAMPWYLAPTGEVVEVAPERLQAHQDPFRRAFEPGPGARWGTLDIALAVNAGQAVALFLALHGGEGEDGTIQGLLERRRIPYTGSSSAASARAFDKVKAKARAAALGARVPEARELGPMKTAEAERTLEELLERHPRWVLKPRSDGSSHGLVHLKRLEDVPAAASMLAALALPYLAEVFVEGRELTVGVFDTAEGPVALPVSEVRLAPNGSFDYEGKYLGRGTEEVTPANLITPDRDAAQKLGLLTHKAVGCFGYSRTDLILTRSGPVLLEINTLPGLTKASFIPQQLAAAGLDFKAFLEGQLELGRQRALTGAYGGALTPPPGHPR